MIEAEVIAIRRSQVVKEAILLNEIQRNQAKKYEVQKKLEKDDSVTNFIQLVSPQPVE